MDTGGDGAQVGATTSKDSQQLTAKPQTSTQSSAQGSPHGSPKLSPAAGDNDEDGSKPTAPLQKRRRVTRACDECRRKKIKCDGKQPCTHCTVYSYECTYDQPSNRRRTAPPQYVESLELQLKRANAIIRSIIPNADLTDPEIEEKFRQLNLPSVGPIKSTFTASSSGNNSQREDEPDEARGDRIESMVKATGNLELDEQGNLEYHGHSSGLTFVRRMRETLGDAMGPDTTKGTPFIKSRPMSQVFDSPRSLSDSPWDSSLPGSDLPPRESTLELCDIAINDAGALLRCVHFPTFVAQLDRIYDLPPESYGNDEHAFLPLLYAVLAVGTVFSTRQDKDEDTGYEAYINEGFKYFKQCRQLMDIADCRDLRQLQAIVYMIMFLQSSAKLSTCYAYIGVALRSALRMGLHRNITSGFNPIECETRKRTFWVIRKMDTYVGALLGLPYSLTDDEIDQELPVEVDDEYITESGISPMPQGKVSLMTAANAHARLTQIVGKIVKYIYPTRVSLEREGQGKPGNTYSVSHSRIMELEKDLQDWQDQLPLPLKPGNDLEGNPILQRSRQLLRMAYAHAQMMLYRPFLHYVSQTSGRSKLDKRSYACAAACVSIARNIVNIAIEMRKKNMMRGAYWFTMYTTFFGILTLVFYALENPDVEASQDMMKLAKEAKETLDGLARKSLAADRCSQTLKSLFENLPIRKGFRKSLNRKRGVSPPPYKTQNQPHHISGPYDDIKPTITTPLPSSAASHFEVDMYHNPQGFDGDYSLSPQNPPSGSFSQQHTPQDFKVSPVMNNFPLADLSAMMFPNPDPFAYPNPNAQPSNNEDANLESLFKGMDSMDQNYSYGASGGLAPVSRTNPNMTPMDRGPNHGYSNNFMPPSTTFMFQDSEGSPTTSHDADVPLLGPMPMYMMQGDANSARPNSSSAQGSRSHLQQLSAPSVQYQQPSDRVASSREEAHRQLRNRYFPNGTAPNMNLDALLGNEEWPGEGPFRGNNNRGPATSLPQGSGNMMGWVMDTL